MTGRKLGGLGEVVHVVIGITGRKGPPLIGMLRQEIVSFRPSWATQQDPVSKRKQGLRKGNRGVNMIKVHYMHVWK
jgi:hypothetical protein